MALDEAGRRFSERLTVPLARIISRSGVTPNTLSLLGLLLTGGVGCVIASGHVFWGGILVLVTAAFDMLDGALARATGRTTRFGALLDSTLDRYSEAILLFALLIVYLGQPVETMLIFAALVGSFLVSYVRARAEGLGIECKVGVTGRAERVLIFAAGLIFGQILPMLWILAAVANFTAVQRIVHVWREAKKAQ